MLTFSCYFLPDPEGKVDRAIVNTFGNPSYKYFYPMPDAIVKSMKAAAAKYPSESKRTTDEL